jgi:hypothetical protein
MYASNATWLLDFFESEIRRGVSFRSDETAQIGWRSVLLRQSDDESLAVLEPRFGSMPIDWIEGANNTLRDLLVQKEVCDQIGAEPNFPSMLQVGTVSPTFLENSEELEVSRYDEVKQDSGWVFRERAYAGSQGDFCSLYQIGMMVPRVVPFLALPENSVVTLTEHFVQISMPEVTISSVDNELLQRLLTSSYFKTA